MIYGLFCGICQNTLNGIFQWQEVFVCDGCGRHWTMVELLMGIDNNNWSKGRA